MYPSSLLTEYRKHNILFIDPGTTTMGIAVYEVDHVTGEYCVVVADTVYVEQYIKHNCILSYLLQTQSLLTAKLEAVSHIVCTLCTRYQVDMVVCEDIYFQHISSHRTMSEGLRAISVGVSRYSTAIELELVPPREVKGDIGVGKNNGDKELMRTAVQTRLAGKVDDSINLTVITEHAIDAIAIGYSYLQGPISVIWKKGAQHAAPQTTTQNTSKENQ